MVAYATIVYFITLFAVMFLYTITWDLYMGFMDVALDLGANATVIGYMYTVHTWTPLALLLSLTIWYLVQAQKRTI